ncbi:MAG: asparagine synthetase B family protein [Sphingomonadaceae bacterium]|nr:asparagine synthetase B family protein [Sphingomonadaceae bacterium]
MARLPDTRSRRIPCYFNEQPNTVWFASDLTTLTRYGSVVTTPDVTALGWFLLAEDITHPRTCVAGVNELIGGRRIAIGDTGTLSAELWSPWMLTGPDKIMDDPVTAASSLRETITACVGAVTAGPKTILLRLSGGLDSSILAAALKVGGSQFAGLNLVTDNPRGDERDFARCVANHLGVSLFERKRQVNDVALLQSQAGEIPRPSARSFTQASSRLSVDVAHAIGADLVVDGGGGDQLFCSLRTARMAADCLLSPSGEGRFWTTAASLARLAEVSTLHVAWRAWAVRCRTSPALHFPIDLRFLEAELRDMAQLAVAHPWLVAPQDALPGKAGHIAALLQAQTFVRGANVVEELPLISPLMSQPIVELCLRIPTWLTVEQATDRAIARRAFAPLLPVSIIGRQSKGSPDSFVIELFEANRTTIRRMLLDGQLAALGLLDLETLARSISDDRPVAGVDFYRIMRLVDVEAWLRAL